MRHLAALVLVALAAALAPAWGFTPETRMRMADEAVRLMPATLRMALETHRIDLMTGVLGPLAEEDAPAHRAPWAGGSLDAALAAEAARLGEELTQRTRFARLAERFGRLAHFVMDAGFPPGVSGAGGDRRFAHFSRFCESRLPKFPLVFYGHDDADLGRGDFGAFARRILARSRDDDRMLARAYAAAGNPPDPAAFDDRSVPFAVASLSYSRTVTEIVRAWLAAWRSAEGDLGRTPYLKPAPR